MKIAFAGDSLTAGRPGSSYFAILRRSLPDDVLVNLGRGNETIMSLNRRISGLRSDTQFDLAFLWVGVNDVITEGSWIFSAIQVITQQLPAKNIDEFQLHYEKTLELLCLKSRHVITVPPILKGEDLQNPWNHQIADLSQIIKNLSSHYDRASFFNLREIFIEKLTEKPGSSYMLDNIFTVAMDILTLHRDEQIDRKAAERGLCLTLDGIHLNSAGARIVADAFRKLIMERAEYR